MTTKKILFICLGNICRSPTAEGVMLAKLKQRNLIDQFQVDSAGTGGWHVGEPPDIRTQKHALSRGYDLSGLRARKLVTDDLLNFDYLVVMDDKNFADVLRLGESLGESWGHKLCKLTDYLPTQHINHVPDPYHGGPEGFELVLDLVEQCCTNMINQLLESER